MSAKGKQHIQLSQKQEQNEQISSKASKLRQNSVRQLERSSVDLSSQLSVDGSAARKKRKKEHVQNDHLKHLIIAGVVVAVIVLLFVPMYRRVGSLENQLERSKQENVAKQKNKNIIVDSSLENAQEVNVNLPKVDDNLPAVEQKWVEDPNSKFFEVPQLVWTYDQGGPQKNPFFLKKCRENIQRYSKLSNFRLIILNDSNYKNLINKEVFFTIKSVLQSLKERMVKQPASNLKEHFQTIKKRLIVYHVLNENGGIFIEKNVFFAETFEWLKDIEHNMHINKANAYVKARYFGFFDLDHCPSIQRYNKTGATSQAEKYMVKYPTFQPYFLAAQPRQEFLSQVLVEYVEILLNPSLFRDRFNKYGLFLEVLQGKDIYFEIFYTCQLIILSRKQEQIDRAGNQFGNKFSIDYYGFLTMNDRYFPKKIGFHFQKNMRDKFYYNLARYSLPYLETIVGPIRYIVHLVEQDNLEIQLLKAREGLKKSFIHPESLLGKFLINNSSQPYVLREYVREVARQKKTWDKLPRKIWQYWDSGLKNSTVANKLCFDNLRRAAVQFNFTVIELNDSNTEYYVGKELNDKINNWIKNAKISVVGPTRSDFIRLAIIAKQGGIYMDLSQFSVNGIEWILNIAQAPIQSITNRYGDMPKVVGSYWPHYGMSFNQSYDKRANTNRQMVNDYQNHFIVAQPNQELLLDWLEQYGRFISSPYSETEQIIKDLGMFGDHWTINGNMYLAAMQSLRIVIMRKNKLFQKMMDEIPNYNGPLSGAEYYGLWSINSYSQLQRFRSHSNFDHTYHGRTNDYNLYLWRYSHEYVQGIIGKVRTFTKLYSWNIKELNNYLNKDYDLNFSNLHPQSLVAKYVYIPKLHKLTKVNRNLTLELINP